ncbi:Ig-like domain-containing protein [Candidatus Saccharibacteria bacterium]|nr:Ig-like domain-containing protein [Candidatus Saccharibacteria bacterium]
MRNSRIILFASILMGLVLVFVLKQALTFHLVSTLPHDGSKPNQYTQVSFAFNRNLAPQKEGVVNQLTIQPAIAGRTTVSGKQVKFIPISAYRTGISYTATLSGIVNSKGEKLKDITISFRPRYIAYKDLPDDVKNRLVGQTDVNDSLTAPYSAAIIAIAGSGKLLGYGMTSEELSNLQVAFYKYFVSTHQEVRAIQLNSITKSPHDPESSSMVDTILFAATWKGSKSYKSKVEYSNLNTTHLYLYDGQTVIFDSGDISS